MKYLVPLIAVLVLAVPVHAQTSEHIESYVVRAEVQNTGETLVDEVITYDFGTEEKHGIYRDIPQERVAGGLVPIQIYAINVTDESGRTYPTKLSDDDGELRIRIGDADTLITGVHTYHIQYVANYAAGHFDDRDELYWNAIGTSWAIPITAATTTVIIPGHFDVSQLHLASYCGYQGTTEGCSSPVVSYATSTNQTSVLFTATALEPYEGMTVAVGFPFGVVPELTWKAKLAMYWDAYKALVVPAIFLTLTAALFLALLLKLMGWGVGTFIDGVRNDIRVWKYSRTHPIIPEYDAGTFSPLEAGVLTTSWIENRFLSAELIWLAVEGYLRIDYNDGDYHFIRTEKDAASLSAYDQKLLEGVAGKKKSDLVNDFYTTAGEARTQVGEVLSQNGFSTGATKIAFVSVAFGIAIASIAWLILLGFVLELFESGWIGFLAFLFGEILIFLWNVLRIGGVRLTDTGLEARHKLLGLKRYIEVAETERITFHNAPEKTSKVFEKLLPFAMVFGLEKKWAEQFKDIYVTPPSWYGGDPSLSAFNTGVLVSSLDNFSSKTSSALISTPSSSSSGSSGGGFSGGGGGGGGGGSW